MKLELYGDKILLKPEESELVTVSGIVLTEEVESGLKYAEVVLVGCGRHAENGDIIPNLSKVGQTIIHNIAHPLVVELAGEKYHLIAESSLLGVVLD